MLNNTTQIGHGPHGNCPGFIPSRFGVLRNEAWGLKHPSLSGTQVGTKVYVGEALVASISIYNETQTDDPLPVLSCNARAYSHRLLKGSGTELKESPLLHRHYVRLTLQELKTATSNRRYELHTELTPIVTTLSVSFEHIEATVYMWAGREAIKSKLCNEKTNVSRQKQLKEESRQTGSNGESGDRGVVRQILISKRCQLMVEARRQNSARKLTSDDYILSCTRFPSVLTTIVLSLRTLTMNLARLQ